jgi:hypothetical protein
MFILGRAVRALDRTLARGKTDLGQTLAVVWMAQVWIMVGSSTAWLLSALFTSGLPFAGLVLASRLQRAGLVTGRTQPHGQDLDRGVQASHE